MAPYIPRQAATIARPGPAVKKAVPAVSAKAKDIGDQPAGKQNGVNNEALKERLRENYA